MYFCPLCEKPYPSVEEIPEFCVQCKRPLIIKKRYRIEKSIEYSEDWGEDFEVFDLKSGKRYILRELRIKKKFLDEQRGRLERQKRQAESLGAFPLESGPGLIDAFEMTFTNSVTHFMIMSKEGWEEVKEGLHDVPEEEVDLGDFDDLDAIFGEEEKQSTPQKHLEDPGDFEDLGNFDDFEDFDKAPKAPASELKPQLQPQRSKPKKKRPVLEEEEWDDLDSILEQEDKSASSSQDQEEENWDDLDELEALLNQGAQNASKLEAQSSQRVDLDEEIKEEDWEADDEALLNSPDEEQPLADSSQGALVPEHQEGTLMLSNRLKWVIGGGLLLFIIIIIIIMWIL